MKLGAVASALVTERTPEARSPEALFAAADRLGSRALPKTAGWAALKRATRKTGAGGAGRPCLSPPARGLFSLVADRQGTG